MTLAYRILGHQDADELAALHCHGFEKPWNENEFSTLLKLPTTLGIGAAFKDNNALSGFALFQHVEQEAELLTIVVSPGERCQGIGSALLRNSEQHLAARGCTSVLLEVGKDNEAALALYKQLGFRVEGDRQNYYSRSDGSRVDALIMRRLVTGLPQ